MINKLLLLLLSFGLSFSICAQNMSYDNKSAFMTSIDVSASSLESFESYANGQIIDSLFNGFITFGGASPKIFIGGWQQNCVYQTVSSKAIANYPYFQGTPIIMDFKEPVFAIGSGVYDDHDGTPLTNTIYFEAITTLGDTITVNETCQSYGDVGFLGATSTDGITRVIWSIDINNGNFELDSLIMVKKVDSYSDRGDFLQRCNGCYVDNESFSQFTNNQQINSLLSGKVFFTGTSPKIFIGGWQSNCLTNSFSGQSLVPQPSFQGAPLVMNLSGRIHGVGANVYDDHDGTPLVNKITLKGVTIGGDTIQISETCQQIGEAGFLGVYSDTVLEKVIWEIDNNDGNLEIDSLTICWKRGDITKVEKNLNNEPSLLVFPNPTNHIVKITADRMISEINIIDIRGVVIESNVVGADQSKIDFSNYTKGVYFVKVAFKDESYKVEKVIKE